MQIILLEKVVNLGQLGEVVKVKDGFARNYLIPQGKAKRATQASIEETIYVQNFRTAQAMGASRGAALSVLARLGLSVEEYAPKRIKMAVTGHGSATKEQVGRMVRSVLGLNHDLPLDESDAAAAALCHAYTGRP